jgi:hypothetical protein
MTRQFKGQHNARGNNMNETSDAEILTETRGAFADGLTLIRFILTPVIMAIIVMGWPSTQVAVLATALLIIAAVTDIFDDIIGGSALQGP